MSLLNLWQILGAGASGIAILYGIGRFLREIIKHVLVEHLQQFDQRLAHNELQAQEERAKFHAAIRDLVDQKMDKVERDVSSLRDLGSRVQRLEGLMDRLWFARQGVKDA